MKTSKLIYEINNLLQDEDLPYYAGHFLSLSLEVFQRYSNLFRQPEIRKYEAFFSMDKNAVALYIRLFSRKGAWFKRETLNYTDLNLELALKELEKKQFLSIRKPGKRDLCDLYHVLTKADIQAILESTNSKSRKESLWEEMLQAHLKIRKNIPCLIRLNSETIFRKLLTIYFGNPYQDLSTFVVEELEHLRHFPVELSSKPIWKNYRQFDEYRHFLDWENEVNRLLDEKEINKANRLIRRKLKQVLSGDYSLPQTNSYTLRRTAYFRFLKFMLHYAPVCHRNFPSAYGRLLSDLSRLQWPKDLTYAHHKLQITYEKMSGRRIKVAFWLNKLQEETQPHSFLEQVLVDKTSAWLEKKRRPVLEVDIEEIHIPFSHHDRNRPFFIVKNNAYTAEEAVVQYLSETGLRAMHSENFFLRLAGVLLFLEEIFLPKNGQFQSLFQQGPLDFKTKMFYFTRRKEIEKKITFYQASPDQIKKNLIINYDSYQNYALPGLYLKALDKALLLEILKVIPAHTWLDLGIRYIHHPGLHGSGFPDLLVIDPLKWEYAFIEVKSPGDRISEAQRYWLSYMRIKKIPCRVISINSDTST